MRNGLLGMFEARKVEQAQASMLVDYVEALVTETRLCTQSAVLSVALDVAIDSAVSRSYSRAQACNFLYDSGLADDEGLSSSSSPCRPGLPKESHKFRTSISNPWFKMLSYSRFKMLFYMLIRFVV